MTRSGLLSVMAAPRDSCYHAGWGKVVFHGKTDELVVHTPKSIHQVQPADCQGLVFLTSFFDDSEELPPPPTRMMLGQWVESCWAD